MSPVTNACGLRTTSSPLIGPSTLPLTTTLRALMPPLINALGETVSEVQCRSPSTCPLTSTAPSALTLPMIFNPSAITVLFRLDANIYPSYTILTTETHLEGAWLTFPLDARQL